MIVALSTSSPLTSVALMSEGSVLWEGSQQAPGRASEVCLALLAEGLQLSGMKLQESQLFVADVGPGSFTGVRVGVTLAKTLGWNFDVPCAEIDAFDLISLSRPVAIPARKGEWFVRVPGAEVERLTTLPANAVGYGWEGEVVFPEARKVVESLDCLLPISPLRLVPKYLAEPSISIPKRPLSRVNP